jgi:hypothetical protein
LSATSEEAEQWIVEVFRPSAMMWVLRELSAGPHSQSSLIGKAGIVGLSPAAVRHALEVGARTNVIIVSREPGQVRRLIIRLSPLGTYILETPIQGWRGSSLAGIRSTSSFPTATPKNGLVSSDLRVP